MICVHTKGGRGKVCTFHVAVPFLLTLGGRMKKDPWKVAIVAGKGIALFLF